MKHTIEMKPGDELEVHCKDRVLTIMSFNDLHHWSVKSESSVIALIDNSGNFESVYDQASKKDIYHRYYK